MIRPLLPRRSSIAKRCVRCLRAYTLRSVNSLQFNVEDERADRRYDDGARHERGRDEESAVSHANVRRG